MKKLCPVCNTINEAIGFNMTEKEIHNISKIGLSEYLCKACYQKELSSMLESTKATLIPLNKEKETLGKAIVAAADKDYATFKGSIADVIRDRVSDAVKDAADEIRQNLFKKPEEE